MVPSFLLRSYLMYAAYIVIWIPSVKLQCNKAELQAACQGLGSNSKHIIIVAILADAVLARESLWHM